MKKITFSIPILIIATLPSIATANFFKCSEGENITFQSGQCQYSNLRTDDKFGLGFDGWEYGTSITKMKRLAHKRNLGISPGLFGRVRTGYDAAILEQKPHSRTFNYWTKVMGNSTKVTLFFTGLSRELYQIKVSINVHPSSFQERKSTFESLYEQLDENYGNPVSISKGDQLQFTENSILKKITDSMLGKLLLWGDGTNNLVSITYKKNYARMSAYQLRYLHAPLAKQNDIENNHGVRQPAEQALIGTAPKL